MINFEIARKEAFDGISETNTINKVKKKTKNKYGYRKSEEIWEIVVEIPIDEKIRDFKLLFNLKPDFPLSIPEVYLSEKDYEKIKYIPHIDDERSICLFDQENIKISTDRPKDIIKACIERAKKIIIDGLQKSNSIDFKDEVVAYWCNTYHINDSVTGGYLGDGVSELLPGKLIVHNIFPSYDKSSLFFGSDNDESKKALAFFKLNGHNLEKQEAFYMGTIDKLEPPFFHTNSSLLDFIESNFNTSSKEIKSYLNQSFDSKFLIFSTKIDEELIFFGFIIIGFKNTQNGWRQNSLNTIKIMSTVQRTAAVQRINFKYFSFKRIKKRTDGTINTELPLKLIIAGLGSIGSNLLFYLSSLELSDLILIDPEVLQFENINRHLMSFHEVGENKADVLAKYMSLNNPFLKIEKYSLSIVDVIEKNLPAINDMDILFCAIGKDSIESYILQCLASGKIEKPVMLLWVEPYMIGAHSLYINPHTGFQLKDLEIEDYYKFNTISKATYSDPENKLLLREAGCQSSYIPYGKESIARFFASFLPDLFAIIKNRPIHNLAFTYIGDLSIAVSHNLEISDFAKNYAQGQLIKQNI